MKADRLMRNNGRNNLWLLRNTNQIYESAVKCYYEHNNSILPHNSASKLTKQRKENFAPLRTLSSQCKPKNNTNYPLNHQEMVERAASANEDKLLNTVMLANRRRSTSFAGNGLNSYVYGDSNRSRDISKSRNDNNVQKRSRQSRVLQPVNMDGLHQRIFSGRSMSLPPTSSTQLGIGKGFQNLHEAFDKSPVCQKQHLMAMEKSSAAALKEVMRHQAKRRLQQFSEDEKLMKVDSALKHTLAAHYKEKKPPPGCVQPQLIKASRVPTEQVRFQTFGERIRQFDAIQFADGPVTFNAFNRRQSHGSGRIQQGSRYGSRNAKSQLPTQVPCLSCDNVLQTNHRQRSANLQITTMTPTAEAERPNRSQMLLQESLGPLQPISQRPEQQQQQQHPPSEVSNNNNRNEMSPLSMKMQVTRSKRSLKLANGSKERMQQQKLPQLQQRWGTTKASIHNPFCRYYPHKRHNSNSSNNATNSNESNISIDSTNEDGSNKVADKTNISSSDNIANVSITDNSNTTNNAEQLMQSPGLIDALWEKREAKYAARTQHLRKMKEQELPRQPITGKRINQMLTASAAQLSAYRRAFLNHQQIKLAELMHNHKLAKEHQQSLPYHRKRQELQQQEQMKALQQEQLEQQQQLRQQRQQQQQQQLLEQQQRLLHQPQQLPVPLQAISGVRGKLKQSLQVLTKSDKTQLPQQQEEQQQQQQQQPQPQPQQEQSSPEVSKGTPKLSLSLARNWQWTQKENDQCEMQELPKEEFFSNVLRKMQQQHLHQQLYQHRQQHQNSDRFWRIS